MTQGKVTSVRDKLSRIINSRLRLVIFPQRKLSRHERGLAYRYQSRNPKLLIRSPNFCNFNFQSRFLNRSVDGERYRISQLIAFPTYPSTRKLRAISWKIRVSWGIIGWESGYLPSDRFPYLSISERIGSQLTDITQVIAPN